MGVCEWDDHTQCRGDEENGSFSQQYNARECVQTKSRMAGGSFSHSLNSEAPERWKEKVKKDRKKM